MPTEQKEFIIAVSDDERGNFLSRIMNNEPLHMFTDKLVDLKIYIGVTWILNLGHFVFILGFKKGQFNEYSNSATPCESRCSELKQPSRLYLGRYTESDNTFSEISHCRNVFKKFGVHKNSDIRAKKAEGMMWKTTVDIVLVLFTLNTGTYIDFLHLPCYGAPRLAMWITNLYLAF